MELRTNCSIVIHHVRAFLLWQLNIQMNLRIDVSLSQTSRSANSLAKASQRRVSTTPSGIKQADPNN